MKKYGMVVLVAIAVSTTVGCGHQIQPRPEVNRPAPAMTVFEEPVTVGHEPEIIGPTEQLRYPRREAFASVDSQTAPIKSETPANNPPPAPLRPRSDVPPLPCSDDYIGGSMCGGGCVGTCSAMLHYEEHDPTTDTVDDSMLGQRVGDKTCIMELILNKDFSIRGARMLDGRIFTYDPTRNRLLEQVAIQTETSANKPWYAVSRAELERDVFPVIAIGMGILFLVLLARAMVRSRRDNHQWPWGYGDRPHNRDRVNSSTGSPTPTSPNHRGGLTDQEFRALSRAEQIRLERAMVDIEIESAREAAQFARQRRRSTLDLEQFLAREDRKLIQARVEADLLIIEAAGDAEIARLNALEAEYDAAKEETEGGFVDDDLFEDTPAATVPSAEDIDDALEQSGFGKEDDDIASDGNV